MPGKQINSLDIDPALNEIERVNKSIAFIANALPEYPHEGGTEAIGTILEALSDKSKRAIREIRQVTALG